MAMVGLLAAGWMLWMHREDATSESLSRFRSTHVATTEITPAEVDIYLKQSLTELQDDAPREKLPFPLTPPRPADEPSPLWHPWGRPERMEVFWREELERHQGSQWLRGLY